MDMQSIALMLSGAIGGGTAIVHGVVTQRHIVRPVDRLLAGDERISVPIRAVTSPLLQFSTYNWLLGGLALIIAAFYGDAGERLAVGLLAGSSFLFGAVCNFRATRGRHPGWALMAIAVALILYGLT